MVRYLNAVALSSSLGGKEVSFSAEDTVSVSRRGHAATQRSDGTLMLGSFNFSRRKLYRSIPSERAIAPSILSAKDSRLQKVLLVLFVLSAHDRSLYRYISASCCASLLVLRAAFVLVVAHHDER